MRRPRLLNIALAAMLAGCGAPAEPPSKNLQSEPLASAYNGFAYDGIDALQARITNGEMSYADVTRTALQRIHDLDDRGPTLNAISELAPNAVARAENLGTGHAGLLAGIPFVVKANIDTAPPMHTHAGSLAIADRVASDHARLIISLQAAGAILVGKSNLSEWANFRSNRSVSGWSSVGGQTRNPHVLDRNPCGSSSGSAVAVAAGLVPLAIGTETHGSIVCPAGVNGIVGMKPTVGLISRDGIIPIAFSFDTAGPMARSVRDVALALQVLAEADPQDPYAAPHPGKVDFLTELESKDLTGARIGVWRAYAGAKDAPRVAAILDQSLDSLEAAGVQLVDPVGLYLDQALSAASYAVMLHEFTRGLAEYLGDTHSLREIMAFNLAHADEVMPWFGQEVFHEAIDSELSPEEYAAALAASQSEMQQSLDDVFAKFQLDAIIAPTNGPAWLIDVVQGDRFGVSSSVLAAISGRPAITLPAGHIHTLPIGVSLVGKMWGDGDLLALAHAVERLLPPPRRPAFISSLED